MESGSRDNMGKQGVDPVSDRIHAARAGDEDAREWLGDWLTPLMLSWTRYQLGRGKIRDVHPEDVVQDVWVRLLPELERFTAREETGNRITPALLGLARRILVHRVIDVRRAASRRRLLRLDETGTTDIAPPVDEQTGPLTGRVHSERRASLEAALERLPARDRDLFVRRVIEQCSIQQLADAFDMTRDQVVKTRQRARKELLRYLSPQLLDDVDPD